MHALRIYSSLSTKAEPSLFLPALQPLTAHLHRLGQSSQAPFAIDLAALAASLPEQTTSDLKQALAWLAKIGALELPV